MGDLIDSLRAQGKVAARGHFTLDAEKAREKMRMFQLADPHRYVLLLVQALAARGASLIAIDIDTDDLRMTSDARPFSREELEDIHGVILGDTAPGPGLRELALGLNAALALNPRWLRLESSTGDAGLRLEQRPEEPDEIEALGGAAPGVRLHIKERFRPGLIARFFRVGSDVLREQVLLRMHCRLAAIGITLDGQPLQKLERDPTVPRWVRVEHEGRWVGRVGLSTEGRAGAIEVLRHEVWLSTHTFEQAELSGVRAVMDASHLRTDVSMAEVVRDEAYEAIVEAMQRALDPVVTQAVSAFGQGQLPPWLAVHLAARIAARGIAFPLSPTMTAWLGVPLWRTLEGKPLATADLLGRTIVGFSTERPSDVPPDVATVVDGTHGVADRLREIFGDRCRDRTDAVLHSAKRLQMRRAFEARKHPLALPDDPSYYGRVDIVDDGDTLLGKLAFHGLAPERGWLRVLLDGCLLIELPMDLPMPRVHAVVTGKLTPTELYDDVMRDQAFADAAYHTFVAYDRAVQKLVREYPTQLDEATRERLCRHLSAMQGDDVPLAWFASLGVAATAAQKLFRDRGRPWRLLASQLVDGCTNPIANAPLFEDAAGAPLGLLAIARHVRATGRVRVVAKGRPILHNAQELLVRSDEKRLKLLATIFGGRAVERAGRDFDRWLARDRFLGAEPIAAIELPRPCRIGPLEYQQGGRTAIVGLAQVDPNAAIDHEALVRVFVEQRELASLRFACGLSGVELALDIDPRWVNAKYDGIEGTAAHEHIAAALAAGLALLVDGIARAPGVAAPIVDLAAMVWPAQIWLDVWLALGRELDELERDRSYGELLRLGDRFAADELQAALREQLRGATIAPAEKIAEGLKSTRAPQPDASAQAIVALERMSRWSELACFPTCGGTQRSFAALLAWAIAKQRIGYVEVLEAGAPPETLLIGRGETARLEAIFGDNALQDIAPALRLQAQRSQFEQRPQRNALALASQEVLVEVAVDHEGLTGTLALPRRPPSAGPGAVTICHRRREFASVDPLPGLPLLGVLDGEGLGVASGFVTLAEPELARVRACCLAHRDDLLRELSRRRNEIDDPELVAAWGRQLVAELAPHSNATHVALAAAEIAEVADLPLFVDSEHRQLTLAALRAEIDRQGDIGFVTVAGLTLDRPLVLIRSPDEQQQLALVFDRVVDCTERARARAERLVAMQNAPQLPAPGADAFMVIEIDERGLAGELWLDPAVGDDSEVSLGVEGRAVDRVTPSKTFPCVGAIQGVELDPDRGRCHLSRPQRSMLRWSAAELYQRLLTSVSAQVPPADDPRTHALAMLLLRLHALTGSSAGIGSSEQRKLYRELRALPLLPLPNGRAISLELALRERPAALASLGLWSPDDPPIDDGGGEPAPIVIAPIPPPVFTPEPPTPTPPSREQVLLGLVRDELRLIRERDESLFAEPYLERIHIDAREGHRVAVEDDGSAILDTGHPVVARALARPDPILVSLLASAAFTVLNVAHEALTDEQEARVLAHHAAYLRTAKR